MIPPLDDAWQCYLRGQNGDARRRTRRVQEELLARKDRHALGLSELLLALIDQDDLAYTDALAHCDRALTWFAPTEEAAGSGSIPFRRTKAFRALVLNERDKTPPDLALAAALREGLTPPSQTRDRMTVKLWVTLCLLDRHNRDPHANGPIFEGLLAALEDGPDDLVASVALHHSSHLMAHHELPAARAALERCVTLRSRAFGVENARTAQARFALAQLCLLEQNWAEALQLGQVSLATMKRLGQDKHPRMGVSWVTVGVAHLELGAPDEASRCFEAAAAIEAKHSGVLSGYIAHALVADATMQASRGNYGKAAALLARVVPALSPEDALLPRAAAGYTNALTLTGRHKLAVTWVEGRLAAWGARASPALRCELEWGIAQALFVDGKVQRGTPHVHRAHKAALDAYGPGSPEVKSFEETLRHLARGDSPLPKWLG